MNSVNWLYNSYERGRGPNSQENFEIKRKMSEDFLHQILEHILRVYSIDLLYCTDLLYLTYCKTSAPRRDEVMSLDLALSLYKLNCSTNI